MRSGAKNIGELINKHRCSRPGFITVAVEGNIGSGKSTFLSQFQNNRLVEVVEEPVSEWCGGLNLLQLMYDDPQRWSFAFQSQVQLSMMRNHARPHRTPVKLLERTLHSARHVFVENLHASGLMSGEQKTVLDEWYQWLHQRGSLNVDLVVYLRTSPQVVKDRIIARGRPEEKGIVSSGLLERLHQLHESWLLGVTSQPQSQMTSPLQPPPGPVLVLDGDRPLRAMHSEYLRCEHAIRDMFQHASQSIT